MKGQAVADWHQARGQKSSFRTMMTISLCLRIARHVKAAADFDFDARIRPNGELLAFECNPRVYLSMDYALLTGINRVEIALRDWTITRSILIREGK